MKPRAIEPTRHPLSALFERFDLQGEDLKALVEDIRHEGLLNPITTHDGMILDGWNRFQACKLAKARPVFISLAPGLDPWEFVKGANMLRRHMPPAERLAVMLLKLQMDGGVPNGTPHDPSVKEIERDLEVSRGTAQRGAQIAKAHDPALNEALADKRISVDRAAELARMPLEERKAAMEEPPVPKAAPIKAATLAQAPGNAALDLTIQLIKTAFKIPEDEAIVPFLKDPLDGKDAEIAELTRKLEEAGAQVQELAEENASMHRILDAEDLLKSFKEEVVRAQALARTTEERFRGMQNQNKALAKSAESWKGKFDRLQKKTKGTPVPEPDPELEDECPYPPVEV